MSQLSKTQVSDKHPSSHPGSSCRPEGGLEIGYLFINQCLTWGYGRASLRAGTFYRPLRRSATLVVSYGDMDCNLLILFGERQT